jgi:hypothetical protein
MLLNLHKKNWTEGLELRDFGLLKKENEEAVKVRLNLVMSRTLPDDDDNDTREILEDVETFISVLQIRRGGIDSDE